MGIEEETFEASIEEKSLSLKNQEISVFSVFGDSVCGEPTSCQHLALDFTPGTEDDDFVQKKCCTFWNFLESQKIIQELLVLPKSTRNSSKSEIGEIEEKMLVVSKDQRNAISMLALAGNAGLNEESFYTKLPQTNCSLGSREYVEEMTAVAMKTMKTNVCGCSQFCSCNIDSNSKKKTKKALVNMNMQMKTWDAVHPKSFDPPGHPSEIPPTP